MGLGHFLLFANLRFSNVSCHVYASFEKIQNFTLGEEAVGERDRAICKTKLYVSYFGVIGKASGNGSLSLDSGQSLGHRNSQGGEVPDPSGQGNPQTCLSFPTPIIAVALVCALAPPPGPVPDELGADPQLWSSPKDLERGLYLRIPALPTVEVPEAAGCCTQHTPAPSVCRALPTLKQRSCGEPALTATYPLFKRHLIRKMSSQSL